jgi:CheY-like chemotaxis protein
MSGAPILVVDDNASNLELARIVLERAGHEVRTATTADEALATLAAFRPRLILMDLHLPGVDGLTLTRTLKADPRNSGIAVLAVTAYAMEGDEKRALDAGCDGWVPKPIDTRALPGQVAALLEKRA